MQTHYMVVLGGLGELFLFRRSWEKLHPAEASAAVSGVSATMLTACSVRGGLRQARVASRWLQHGRSIGGQCFR